VTVRADELARMQRITTQRWLANGPMVEQHVGDLAWGSRPTPGAHDASAHLLDDDGFAFVDDVGWHVVVRPGAEHRYNELLDMAGPDATIVALDRDEVTVGMLASRGYRPVEDAWDWHFVRRLDDLPPVELPPGSTVTDATDDSVIGARVAVHRAAWEPSRFTEDSYRHVRATPPYRPELDIGVVDGNGTWAAYCIAWLDAEARAGELEPVGAAPGYRRRGLARAACLAAMHRLRDAGATTCVVYAVSDERDPGPRALYASLGSERAARHLRYRRA
jgi:ribosomal protein S18 acetylase RimI-like enzyme